MAVVGRGSNLLVSDAGFRGLALRLVGRLTAISVRGSDLLVRRRGLPAARRAARGGGRPGGPGVGASIPGTAGGAVAMNAGAHSGLAWPRRCAGPWSTRRRAAPRRARRPDPRLPQLGDRPGRPRGGGGLRAASRRRRGDRGPPGRVPRPAARDPAAAGPDLRQRLHQPARRLGRPAARGGGRQGPADRRGALLAGPRTSSRPSRAPGPRTCWR